MTVTRDTIHRFWVILSILHVQIYYLITVPKCEKGKGSEAADWSWVAVVYRGRVWRDTKMKSERECYRGFFVSKTAHQSKATGIYKTRWN